MCIRDSSNGALCAHLWAQTHRGCVLQKKGAFCTPRVPNVRRRPPDVPNARRRPPDVPNVCRRPPNGPNVLADRLASATRTHSDPHARTRNPISSSKVRCRPLLAPTLRSLTFRAPQPQASSSAAVALLAKWRIG
eukprot:13113079-Alexandrium_andersonii.AAC.1